MNEKKRRVFIPNRGGHDYSAAREFGELIFMTEGKIDRFATGWIYRRAVEILEDAGPDDFIMEAGPSVAVTIASAVFARKFGRLNLLLFRVDHGQDPKYVARNVDLDSLIGD